MAKKEKLKTDDFDLDSELDFDNFDINDIESNLSPEAKKPGKRTPVMDVFRGTVGGIKSTASDPRFLADLTKRALPETYGEVFKAGDQVAGAATALYDEAVRELKPQLGIISKKIDRLVPDESKFLKKVTGRLASFFGSDETPKGPSKEEIQNQSIQTSLAQVFEQKQELEQQAEARENAEQKVSQHIEGKRFESNFGLLNSINEAVTRTASYTDRVNQAFQRKSLELQFRSYFVQSELLQATNRYFEVFRNQNEAIAKNTALPEFVKINNSERFKDIARNKFFTNVQDSLFGKDSWFGGLAKKLKEDGKKYIQGIKQGLGGAMAGIDSVEELKSINQTLAEAGGTPISGAELAGNALGGGIANKAGEWIGDKARPFLENTKGIAKLGNIASTVAMNPGGALDDWQNSQGFKDKLNQDGFIGKAFQFFDSFINYAKPGQPSMQVDNPSGIKGMDLGSVFNERTQRSIVEIIPGYLSRILREVTVLRTGDDQAATVLFDHTSGKFVDKKEVGKSIKKTLRDRVDTSAYGFRVNAMSEEFLGDRQVDDDQKKKLSEFFSNLSMIPGMNYTSENIMNTRLFASLDQDMQDLIREQFEGQEGDDYDKAESMQKRTKRMTDIKSTTPDVRGEIEQFIKAGYGDILEEQGLVKRDNNNNFHIQKDAYAALLQETPLITSDRNKKRGIKEIKGKDILDGIKKKGSSIADTVKTGKPVQSAKKKYRKLVKSDVETKEGISTMEPSSALDAIKNTRIFKWFYKKGEGDSRERTGPMAQDVNQTMGEDAAPGGTKIDLTTMNGNNMAAIQALSEKQDQMMQGDKSASILSGIKEDTIQIVKLLESSGTRGVVGEATAASTAKAPEADDKSYTSLFKTILSSTASMMGKAGGDLAEAGKKVFGFTKDKLVLPAAKKMSSIYDNNKDSVASAFGTMLSKAGQMASKAMEVGQDIVFNKLPSAARQAAILGGKIKDKLKEWLNGARDVYIKGRESPVIQASLMKAGYYRDQATGKVLKSMDDLKDLKGNVIGAAGNVVLTIEEAAEGLYDQYGQKIKGVFGKLASFAAGAAVAGFQRAKKFWKEAIPVGKGILGKVKGLFKKGKETISEKMDGMSIGGTFSFGTDKIYDVLVEMRDLMRGEDPPKHETKKDFKKFFVGPMPEKELSKRATQAVTKAKQVKDELTEGASNLFGTIKSKVTGEHPDDEFVGPMPESLVSQAKGKMEEVKESISTKVLGKPKDDEFVGPVQPGLIQQGKDKLEELKGNIKESINTKVLGKPKDDEFVGPMPESLVSKAKDKMEELKGNIKEKIFGKSKSDDFTGPMPQGLVQKGQDKMVSLLSSIRDLLKKKDEETGADAAAAAPVTTTTEESEPEAVEPLTADTSPRYQSGNNAIDSIFSAGKKLKEMAPAAMEKLGSIKGAVAGGKGIKGKMLAGVGALFKGKGGDEPTAENEQPKQTANNAEQEKSKSLTEKAKDLLEKGKDKVKSVTKTITGVAKGKQAFNDKDGSGRRDGSWEDRIEKMEQRKKDNKKDPLQADLQARYKSDQNIIDTIMQKAGGIFDLAKGGLTSVLGGAGDLLSGGKGMLGKLGKFAKSPIKGTLGAIGSVGKGAMTALRTVGKPLVGAAKAIGNIGTVGRVLSAGRMVQGALTVGSLMTGGIGSVAMGGASLAMSALGGILASPVLLGGLAVAGVGYAGYKAFKFLTRNKVNEFDVIRMRQYGLSGDSKSNEYNSYMLGLEDYLQDGRIGYDQGKAYILAKKVKEEELLEIFKIDKDDDVAIENFKTWFQGRFKPFFLTHLTALFAADNKAKLENVPKLKPEALLKYLQAIKFDGGPYGETTSPIADLQELSNNKDQVNTLIDEQIAKVKKAIGTDKKKDKAPVAPVTPNAADKSKAGEVKKSDGSESSTPETNLSQYKGKGESTLSKVVKTGALALLGAMLPVPAVIGGLAYGAFKLYKYFTRNNANTYDTVRLYQYGMRGSEIKDGVSKVLGLEEYLQDGRIGYDKGKAYLIDKKVEKEELLSIFKIDKDDTGMINRFGKWFEKRFKPFFLTHLTALYAVNNKSSLSKIEDLKPDDKVKYLEAIKFDGGPYDYDISPFKEVDKLDTDKKSILLSIDNTINTLKSTLKKDKKVQLPDASQAVKPPAAKPSQASAATPAKPTTPAPVTEVKKDELPKTQADQAKQAGNTPFEESGEGDGPMKDGVKAPSVGAAAGGAGQKLVQAEGPLRNGEGAMQYMTLQPGVKLDHANPAVLKNFMAMVQEYGETTGKKIIVTSGARTTKEQEELYRKNPRKAARPGRSLHEFGLALDVNSPDLDALDQAGLMRKYGFTRPVGGEPWHMEPAGIQVNIPKAKEDPGFAEQAVQASLFKGGGGIGSISGMSKDMLGKRDPAMAMQLLESGSVEMAKAPQSDKDKAVALATNLKPEVKQTQEESKDKPKAQASATGVTASAGGVSVSAGPGGVSAGTGPGGVTASVTKPANDPSMKDAKPPVLAKAGGVAQQTAQSEKYSKVESLPDIEEKPQVKQVADAKDQPKDPRDRKEVRKSVENIAKKQNVEPEMMSAFAAVESSLNPFAKAPNTSATGLYQFTKATWDEQMMKNARKYDLDPSTSPTDVKAATLMATEYIKSNKKQIKSVKPDPSLTDIYLTHFLGAGGARKLLSADPNAIAAQILPSAAKSNQNIFYDNGRPLTVSEVYNKIDKKLTKTAKDFGIQIESGQMPTGGKPGSRTNETSTERTSEQSTSSSTSSITSTSSVTETGGGSTTTFSDGTVTKQPAPSTTATANTGLTAGKPAMQTPEAMPRADASTPSAQVGTSPLTSKGLFKPQQPTVIASNDLNSGMRGMATGTGDMGEVTNTLVKQLDVQSQMLEVLKAIAEKVGPEQFKGLSEAIGNMAKPVTPTMPKAPSSPGMTSVKSAVDLGRKVA